ncbi:GGDEF domain-containing protein [Thalassotalea sp. PS06]|uniref:GGDEF domain-containing protein n=1 Tax=Thalassotalea sp. PS06 TaxID=2594005 RepID=UPI00163D870A|nr:GGDEF domain-containing protein [Thalassotalea sp. PS06]
MSFFIAVSVSAHDAAPDYRAWQNKDLLDEATQVRSTDIELSATLLEILKNRSLSEQEKAHYDHLQAYRLILEGKYQDSLEAYQKLKKSDDVNIRLQALSYIMNLHLLQRDHQLAVDQLNDILGLLPHPQIEPELYTKTLMGIGYFHNQLGAHKQALEYLGRLTNRHLTERQQCLVFSHKLSALIGLNSTSPDDVLYHSTMNFCKDIGETIIVEGVMADMAELQVREGNYAWVIDNLAPRLSSVEKGNYPMNKAEFYAHLAVSFYHTGDTERAWEFSVKAMEYASQFRVNHGLYEASKVATKLARSKGTPEQVYVYMADQLERQHNHYLQQRAQESVRKHLEFELDKNKQLITELSDHLAKQHSQLKIVNREIDALSQQNLISIGYIALGGIVIAGLMLSVFGIRSSRNALLDKLQLDPLTKVFHRANLLKHFSIKWQELQQQQHNATLLCLQLDQLSEINYRSGHTLTDWLIERTTEILQDNAPHGALIGRYKGDMLVMLLPNTNMHTLMLLHSKIIKTIDTLNPRMFLTYRFPYHTTSMLVDLSERKETIYSLLASCEARMQVDCHKDGHKLIVDGNSDASDNSVKVDAKAPGIGEVSST